MSIVVQETFKHGHGLILYHGISYKSWNKSRYDIPVMHNSLSTQFTAKIVKSLFPENFPLSR